MFYSVGFSLMSLPCSLLCFCFNNVLSIAVNKELCNFILLEFRNMKNLKGYTYQHYQWLQHQHTTHASLNVLVPKRKAYIHTYLLKQPHMVLGTCIMPLLWDLLLYIYCVIKHHRMLLKVPTIISENLYTYLCVWLCMLHKTSCFVQQDLLFGLSCLKECTSQNTSPLKPIDVSLL